jgi:hypothetical protein
MPHYSPSLPFRVDLIPTATAKLIIEQYHYSRCMPHGKSVCYGAFLGEELYAVSVYGVGVNMVAEAYLKRETGLEVARANLFELKRLARKGERGESKISLTKFLAICHRALKKEHGIRFIYSFSDPEHSHDGTIYKAANFIHMGETQEERHYKDSSGKDIHRRVPYRWMQRRNIKAVQESNRRLEWEQRCELERQRNDIALVYGRRWPVVTHEIQYREAKKLLRDQGEHVFTIADAREEMLLTPNKTQQKTRWFLPLDGEDRNALLRRKSSV